MLQLLSTYNLAFGADTPLYRIIDLIPIADSKPKIAILCSSYTWLTEPTQDGKIYFEDRFTPDSPNIQLDSYTKSLFNDYQLNILKPDPIHQLLFKKRFIVPALTETPIKYSFRRGGTKKTTIALKSSFDNLKIIELKSTDNNNKKAFRYMIKYLKDRGIRVIIVNMPANPYYFEHSIGNRSHEIYSDFMKQLECPYYDLGSLCSPGEFVDHGHPNINGSLNITARMGEIIAMEAKNVSA